MYCIVENFGVWAKQQIGKKTLVNKWKSVPVGKPLAISGR